MLTPHYGPAPCCMHVSKQSEFPHRTSGVQPTLYARSVHRNICFGLEAADGAASEPTREQVCNHTMRCSFALSTC